MAAQLIRFFAEEGADRCLWGEDEDPGRLESELPIPAPLRTRMHVWIREYDARVLERDPGPFTPEMLEAFDRRGYQMSRELQERLDEGHHSYRVLYFFLTAAVREWASAEDTGVEDGADGGSAQGLGVDEPCGRRLGELLRAVAVLALPAERQVEWLAARGGPVSGEGLVVDVYETGRQMPLFARARWVTDRASEQVLELVRVLTDMSRPGQAHLWTRAALFDEPRWEEVRRLAAAVLAQV